MPRAVRRQRRGHTAGLIDRGGLRNDRRSLISISGGRYFLDRSSDHPIIRSTTRRLEARVRVGDVGV